MADLIYYKNQLVSKMGADQPQSSKFSKEELKSSHPWHQKSWIVKQEDKSFIQSSYPIEEKRYEQWRAHVEKVAGSPNKQFLYLPTDMGYVGNTEGSKDGYVVVNYPCFPFNLADQIKLRKPEHAYFKEKQLYYLLFALVAVKVDAKSRGQVVGDIRPANIFLSQGEQIKVGTLESFPHEQTNYAKFNNKLVHTYDVLLAPEDLKLASQNRLDNKQNTASEIFSIGATIMSAGLLDDLSSIYDYPNLAFKGEEHTARTTEWLDHPNYTEIFKSIILSLLNPNPEKRISIEDLWTFLLKYKSSILSKEQFIVSNPPEPLETGVSIIRSKIK